MTPTRTHLSSFLAVFWLVGCSDPRPVEPPVNGDECYDCHGDARNGNSAPPPAFWRDGVVADPHQAHLGPSAWHRQVVCTECHLVPEETMDPGHIDTDLPAELTWSGVAVARDATPTYAENTQTCSGVYCHGAELLPGGNETAPVWSDVDGSAAVCGSCHGFPPDPPHPQQVDSCAECHGEVIADDLSFVAPELHIDGTVQRTSYHPDGWAVRDQHGHEFDRRGLTACSSCHGADLTGGQGPSCDTCHNNWKTDCTFCHGGVDNQTGAPPESVFGELLRTTAVVGAHTEHVEDTLVHAGRPCTMCHIMPTSALSPGHIDGDAQAEVVFGSLNPGASYDFGADGCSSTYCHGNGWDRTGGQVWSQDPTLACSACHHDETVPSGTFRMSGRHSLHVKQRGYACVRCHATVVDAQKQVVGLALHVDGTPNVSLQNGGSYNPTTRSCSPSCHGSETW